MKSNNNKNINSMQNYVNMFVLLKKKKRKKKHTEKHTLVPHNCNKSRTGPDGSRYERLYLLLPQTGLLKLWSTECCFMKATVSISDRLEKTLIHT